MKNLRSACTVPGALLLTLWVVLDLSTAAATAVVPAAVSAADARPATLSYFTDAPCPPTAASPAPLRVANPIRRTRRPARHHRKAARHPLHVTGPRPHPAHRRRAHHRAHRVAAIASPGRPSRCEILHREPLLRDGVDRAFGLTPAVEAVALTPAEVVTPPSVIGFNDQTPFQAFGSGPGGDVTSIGDVPPIGGGSGRAPTTLIKPAPPAVSAAPEPDAWVLLLAGVGLIGSALRTRRSRAAVAG